MSVSVLACVIVFTMSLSCASGFVLADRRAAARQALKFESPDVKNQDIGFKFDTMLVKFQDLAAGVGEQVDDYAVKIQRITESIASVDQHESARRVSDYLLEANQQLQSELAIAKAEIERQRQELGNLLQETRTDALTGILNRRAFDQELARSLAIYRRKNTAFSLIMIDIDHFKRLNDVHGHLVGDRVLKALARCLTGSFRETDLIFRYGGEEFAILLPHTSLREALSAAERTRVAITECRDGGSGTAINITASFGVKEVASHDTEESVVKAADEALYAAKNCGRNATWYLDGMRLQRIEAKSIV